MTTTVTLIRPRRQLGREYHIANDQGLPACGVRKSGRWQVVVFHDPTCKRCIKFAQAK